MLAIVGSILLGGVAVLYVLLALGAPLGEFAMGGAHKIMPKKMRITSAVSVLIQLLGIFVLLQLGGIFSVGFPQIAAKYLAYGFGFYFGLNVLMNLASKSSKERQVMTPLAFITAISFLYMAFQA
ncbi:hypothetical protein [Enterococcus sp. LJL51]|uniref:hypothetical protein n=1 Tax=Enterococcus sp. LJL51 TaxID=3416656 RepID=UPI003CF40A07